MTGIGPSWSFALANGIVRFWIEKQTLTAKPVLCTAQICVLVGFLRHKRT
jgi:hypothetical protein